MTSRKFKHWAYLNKEGMELFGKVFKNRQVPVISMIPKTGPLGIHENIEEYFTGQWDELKDDQRDEILNILSKKFGVTKRQVKDQIEEIGLPLRIEEYFTVQWDELKDDQRDEILNILSKKFGVTKRQVKDQIEEIGLPLRSSLTNGSGTNHPGFFT